MATAVGPVAAHQRCRDRGATGEGQKAAVIHRGTNVGAASDDDLTAAIDDSAAIGAARADEFEAAAVNRRSARLASAGDGHPAIAGPGSSLSLRC